MAEKTMKVFVTKFALTKGILAKTVSEPPSWSPRMVRSIERPKGLYELYHNNEWHREFAEAQADAEDRRTKKIASLKKQIARLEALSFSKDPQS